VTNSKSSRRDALIPKPPPNEDRADTQAFLDHAYSVACSKLVSLLEDLVRLSQTQRQTLEALATRLRIPVPSAPVPARIQVEALMPIVQHGVVTLLRAIVADSDSDPVFSHDRVREVARRSIVNDEFAHDVGIQRKDAAVLATGMADVFMNDLFGDSKELIVDGVHYRIQREGDSLFARPVH